MDLPSCQRQRPLRTGLATAIGVLCALSALGQGTKPPAKPNAKPPVQQPAASPTPSTAPSGPTEPPGKALSADPGVTFLADEPLTIDSIGMTFYPPADAKVESTSAGNEGLLQILAKDQTWKIEVRAPRTAKSDISAQAAGEAALQRLLESVGNKATGGAVKSLGKVIDRTRYQPTTNPALEGYRFYVSLPAPGSGKDPNIIRGFTVIKVGKQWFAAFDLSTTEPCFDAARRAYETVVASAQYADIDQINATRGDAVNAGVHLFQRLSPEDYLSAIAVSNDRWERLFMPSETGADSDDREIAYRRIRCRVGSRHELETPGAKPPAPGTDDTGYILQIDARYLDGKRTIDSQSLFFMSNDREQELWTVRNAVREGQNAATTIETGVRSGKNMTIQKEASGQPTYSVKPRFESAGYVSQFEAYLLPQLMIGLKLPTEFAFYVYSFRDSLIRLRRDTLEQPPDRPGLWRLTTRMSEDSKKVQVSLYNDAGHLIRTELPDGSIWEPVEFDHLLRLWKNKNLPMD